MQLVLDSLVDQDKGTGPFGCRLYAPVDLEERGWTPSGSGTYTRFDNFQYGWEYGQSSFWIAVHAPDTQNVNYLFDVDPDGVTYSDGSVMRGTEDATALLLTIPGSPCYYELLLSDVPMSEYQAVQQLYPINP